MDLAHLVTPHAGSQLVLYLREGARQRLGDGQSREELLSELEAIRLTLRRAGVADAEDAVLDVMDFVVGWASPHMKV